MRHQKTIKKLGRNRSARKALLVSLIKELIKHKKIVTTVTKAKALRPEIEHLITIAKKSNLTAERQLFAVLQSHTVVKELMKVTQANFQQRPGGYTRITKLPSRVGDGAMQAQIALII